MKTLKGKFIPRNVAKYRGDYRNIIYRSSWELKFMKYCDMSSNIMEWGSEEIVVPYRSPLDGRVHRYFPDFYIKVRQSGGTIQKFVVEVKPKRQTKEPKVQRKMTKKYIYEVTEYAKNQAKWKAAKEYCDDRNYKFMLITEKELQV